MKNLTSRASEILAYVLNVHQKIDPRFAMIWFQLICRRRSFGKYSPTRRLYSWGNRPTYCQIHLRRYLFVCGWIALAVALTELSHLVWLYRRISIWAQLLMFLQEWFPTSSIWYHRAPEFMKDLFGPLEFCLLYLYPPFHNDLADWHSWSQTSGTSQYSYLFCFSQGLNWFPLP